MISPDIEHLKKQVRANPDDIDLLKALVSRLECSGVASKEDKLLDFIYTKACYDATICACIQKFKKQDLSIIELCFLLIETLYQQKSSLQDELIKIEEIKGSYHGFIIEDYHKFRGDILGDIARSVEVPNSVMGIKYGDLVKYDDQGLATKAEESIEAIGRVAEIASSARINLDDYGDKFFLEDESDREVN